MRILYLSISNDAARYVKEKEKTAMEWSEEPGQETKEPSAEFIEKALSQTKKPAPVIATREQFYDVDQRQRVLVEVAERCAIQELAEDAPLIDGEAVEEDFFSYLLEPFEDLPVNTGVLKRTTNMAVILYIFDLVLIDNGNVVHLPPPPAVVPPPRPILRGGGGGSPLEITGKMIKGMLKSAGLKGGTFIAEKFGAMIIGIVMEQLGMKNDEQKMMEQIGKIMREEIEGNEIEKMEAAIAGTMHYLNNEYKNRRRQMNLNDITQRKDLSNSLTPYSTKFYTEVISLLMREKYAVKGLKTFMLGASVHLLITQELALVDPYAMNPNDSGYLLTLRDNANTYKNHVETSYNKAMRDRDNMEVVNDTFIDFIGNSMVRKTMYKWVDRVTGQQASGFSDTKNPKKSANQWAYESLENHRREVLEKRRTELGKPLDNFLPEINPLLNFSFPK